MSDCPAGKAFDLKITVTDNERWRIERLQPIGEKLRRRFQQIVRLEDHKGQLFVFWNEQPRAEDRSYVNKLWRMAGEALVHHEVVREAECSRSSDGPTG